MRIALIFVAGLVLADCLNVHRFVVRREAAIDDHLRAPRSAQVDEVLDPAIEDQLALENAPTAAAQQLRPSVQVVPLQPRYLDKSNDLPVGNEYTQEDLDVYIGGGRRQTRSSSSENNDEDHVSGGLVDTVALDAVKIRPHGKLGRLVKPRPSGTADDASIVHSRTVFDDSYYRRQRRMSEDFIPFSEYDARRVQTLKIEQNDFLALPIRLRALETIDDMVRGREKRKFPVGADEEGQESLSE